MMNCKLIGILNKFCNYQENNKQASLLTYVDYLLNGNLKI